jgi:hypothetical protein
LTDHGWGVGHDADDAVARTGGAFEGIQFYAGGDGDEEGRAFAWGEGGHDGHGVRWFDANEHDIGSIGDFQSVLGDFAAGDGFAKGFDGFRHGVACDDVCGAAEFFREDTLDQGSSHFSTSDEADLHNPCM